MARWLIAVLLGGLLGLPLHAATRSLPASPAPRADESLTGWRDDAGTRWQPSSSLPQRWVVLGPHLVDMLHAIGARERIVGVQDDHLLPGAYRTSLSGHPVVGFADRVHDERL